MLVPTAPEHPTIAAVADDPIGVNSRMGIYTNFMNLLDLAGVAVPAGQTEDGLFGVTVVVRGFEDQIAIDLASILTGEAPVVLPTDAIELAVFGAHLDGEPLNGQLVSLGARFVSATRTSDDYRMYALPGAMPKPGVVRVEPGSGVRLDGEIWALSSGALGRFLAALPQPMSLGKILLDDGREVLGFGCSWPKGQDISSFGGWRAYLASLAT
jgi:allophanate hydrolase